MYGVLIEIAKHYIIENYGENTWIWLCKKSNSGETDIHCRKLYPNNMLEIMITVLSNAVYTDKDTLLYDIGRYTIQYLARNGYNKLLTALGKTFKDLLSNMNDHHEYLRYSYHHIKPPTFVILSSTPKCILLEYSTRRPGYNHYAKGLLVEVAKHFYQLHLIVRNSPQQLEGSVYRTIFTLELCVGESFQENELYLSKTELAPVHEFPKVSNKVLFDLIPFHLVLDENLIIRSAGERFLKFKPNLKNSKFQEYFIILLPYVKPNFERIIMFRFCTFKIALKLDNGKSNYKHRPLLHLKGAMFYIEEWSMLLFIGKPSIMKAKSMVDGSGDSMSEELLLLLKKQKKESKELTKTARRLDGQRRKTFDLLIQCLPREVAKQIRQGMLPSETIKTYDSVTICFTKVVNFSNYCNRMCAQEIVGVLNRMYTLYDSMTGSYNVYKVETVNDSYMLVSGAPSPSPFHSAHIIEIALDILESTKQNLFWPSEAISKDLTKTQHEENVPLQLCIGCHTGSIVAGIVGFKSPRFCLFGDTVNTASRMMSAGLPDTVHVSSTLAENLSNYPYILESRGEQMIKGKGKMFTYFVRGRKTNFTTIDTVTGEELDFKKLLQEDIRINNQEIDESDDFDSEIHLDNNENDTSSVTISEMSSIADDLEYFPEIQELNLNKTNNFIDDLNTSNKNYVDVNHNEAFYEHEIQLEEMNLVQRKQNQPDLKLIYNMEYPDVLKDTENQSASDLTFTSSRSILFENLANPLTLGVTQVGIVQPENPLKYLGAWLYKYAENSTKENS
ncbi:unnamed protein product [Heterobilharzia americana]|nr:unnamed protein product [Heterobilharzia americana]